MKPTEMHSILGREKLEDLSLRPSNSGYYMEEVLTPSQMTQISQAVHQARVSGKRLLINITLSMVV